MACVRALLLLLYTTKQSGCNRQQTLKYTSNPDMHYNCRWSTVAGQQSLVNSRWSTVAGQQSLVNI
jgi:hypothetical protein